MKRALLAAVVLGSLVAQADEGMWLLNNFPSDKVSQKYGFKPTQDWLNHIQLSSARLARGCSGSFVSPNGLVMTNHHCAHHCIEQLSTKAKDYVASGYYAKTEKDEIKCPDVEINQLLEIKDVTADLNKMTAGLEGAKFNDKLKAAMSDMEKACSGSSEAVRCDVVTLYHGGQYHLYKYKRFQDVRLVFAPEFATAFFGGDPDNFMFPRYDLDVAYLRVYENNAPAKMDHYFKWNAQGVKEGDLTFVAGNPGRTSRGNTVAELEYQRDVTYPTRLMHYSELRGLLTEFQTRGAEQKRIANATLFYIENALKAYKGREQALLDKAFFASKVKDEQDLRAKVNADPKKKAAYGAAWDNIEKALAEQRNIQKQLNMLEAGHGFDSEAFGHALRLVRAAEELPKPNETRLREYTDGQLPMLKQALLAKAPIYPEFEIETFAYSLAKLREELGPDDPLVKQLLGSDSPRDLATRLVKGTKLGDVKVREALFNGGAKAIDASKDPMILFAKQVDPAARKVRKHFEDDIESVLKKNSELVAKARFEAYGTSVYPDATLTLRLSYGSVKGWSEAGKNVNPLTTFAGAFERHTGKEPFALPKSWMDKKASLNLNTAFDMATTNDIIGGNSGSPVVNQQGEVVGLVFDGNIHSLGGEFGFDETKNRTVSVHSAALTEALDKIYGATRVVNELKAGAGGGATGSK